MKVLLAHVYFLEEDEREKKIMKPYPPLGLLSISAFLDRKGYAHEVFDGTFLTKKDFMEKISACEPDLVAFYCNLMTKVNVVHFTQILKKERPGILIAIGGPDVRYNVEDYLNSGVDTAIIGEGEESFIETLAFLKEGKDLSDVKGIAFRKHSSIIQTEARPLIRDVDDLPYPALEKVDIDQYLKTWRSHHGMSMLSINTQRGCPYTCKWCSTAVYGQTYRRKSPQRTIKEIQALKSRYNNDAIWFVDDVFTISHRWLQEFRDLLVESGTRISYECISRSDRMNEDVVKLLKDSGCFRIWIGAESGSQSVLDAMDRRVNAVQVREMIKLVRSSGIECGTFIMLGYPGETEKDIEETIEHLVDSQPDHFAITLAYPIKGTPFYDEVQHIQTKQIDWQRQSDRERDFQRKYSKGFYRNSVRRITNEVALRRRIKERNGPALSDLSLYLKSRAARLMNYFLN